MTPPLPLISIVTPVYNTPPEVLEACIESVKAQTYFHWELCLCDDCSTSEETRAVLARYHGADARIKLIRSPSNLHISGASNLAATLARGELLTFLDHDDTLAPDAINKIAAAIQKDAEIDLLYSDEDKIDEQGNYCDPYFKPDWSPEHLLSVMYVLHPLTIRKALFFKLGGFRSEYSGAQDYDLALRASIYARKVHHIPEILYHWRKVKGSASAEVDAKPYALSAAHRALVDHLVTRGMEGEVLPGRLPGTFRVKPKIPPGTPVTLLFLTNDGSRTIEDGKGERTINLLQNSIESVVSKSTYPNYSIVVVDNGNASSETKALLEKERAVLHSYAVTTPFNFADKLNYALSFVETEQVILLNDDIEVISPDWIEALLEWSTQPEVGAVGARLLYPNNTIQHSGIALGEPGIVAHTFYKLDAKLSGYYGYTDLIRNYSAVTGAVLATKMSILKKIGKVDTFLAIDFNDIDLCLRIGLAGYRIVFTPYAELYHLEGSTAKRTSQNPREVERFRTRWESLIKRDPYLNYQAIKSTYPSLI